jgi:L-ascorbate metabolism protein UlaG (beta-lactamase superfamily)
MKLTYIYHSGFAITDEHAIIVIDYWHDPACVMPRLLEDGRDLYLLSSHFHEDHFNPEILKWRKRRQNIQYILSKDILRHRRAQKEDGVFLAKGAEFTDKNLSIKAYGSTDSGVSWYIEAEGKRIFHAGDLNNWYWTNGRNEKEAINMEKHFLGEIKDIRKDITEVDLAMFPVDARLGNEYMRGPEQFLKNIRTHLFAPMHFSACPIEMANLFKGTAKKYGTSFFTINKEGDSINI